MTTFGNGLWPDPRCTCDVATRVATVFAGGVPDLCPVHEPDELEIQTTDRKRAGARAHADRVAAVIGRMREDDALSTQVDNEARAEREHAKAMADLHDREPLLAALVAATRAPVPVAQPEYPALNSRALEDQLRSALGIPPTSANDPQTDQGDFQ